MASETSSFGTGKREGHDASKFYGQDGLPSVKEDLDDQEWQSMQDAEPGVYQGDSRHLTDNMPLNSVALMVTSPPYFAGKDYDGGSWEEYLDLLHDVLSEVYRVLIFGGRACVNVANIGRKPYIDLRGIITKMMEDIGYLPRGEIIWVKAKGAGGSCAWGTHRSPRNPTLRDVHEYVIVMSKKRYGRIEKPVDKTMESDEFSRNTLSVWEIPPESAKRIGHPAPFPVELPKRLIELYSYPGDVVLDPFCGSGTTGVAASLTGRRYVLYDSDPQYVELARKRLT